MGPGEVLEVVTSVIIVVVDNFGVVVVVMGSVLAVVDGDVTISVVSLVVAVYKAEQYQNNTCGFQMRDECLREMNYMVL